MGLSAVCMAVAGVTLSFLPAESLVAAGVDPAPVLVVFVQVTAALYLGFAVLNWSARGVLIGGIYARPVALGNFMHFAVVAATLVKAATGGETHIVPTALAILYTVFALWFAVVLFGGSPVRERERE
jgi:hypothetical protein